MKQFCWWLVDKLSRTLEPDERDAVQGDFAESGAAGGQALRELLGLVARRQAAMWKDWRPWLALLGIVGPVGMQLSRIAISTSVPLWMNLSSFWTYGVPYRNGLTILEEIVVFVCHSFAVALWSWTSGFVLGCLSGRAVWVNGLLLCLVSSFSASVPSSLFVLFPFFWGARHGHKHGALEERRTVLLATAITAMLALVTWTSGWRQAGILAWSEGVWQGGVDWQTRLVPFTVVSWPVVYVLAVAWSRPHGRRTA